LLICVAKGRFRPAGDLKSRNDLSQLRRLWRA
jgi:hypothetical protein